MGRIKTKLVKAVTLKLFKENREQFTDKFEENKVKVSELAKIPSKKLRNIKNASDAQKNTLFIILISREVDINYLIRGVVIPPFVRAQTRKALVFLQNRRVLQHHLRFFWAGDLDCLVPKDVENERCPVWVQSNLFQPVVDMRRYVH